jgi:hypothetical protein
VITNFELLCRPKPPPEFARNWKDIASHLDGVYRVTQCGGGVAIYHPAYFRSIDEVTGDLLEMIYGGWGGPWGDDYVVWCSSRVMAALHQPMGEEHIRIVTFDPPRNDPVGGFRIRPLPYWPTYEQ